MKDSFAKKDVPVDEAGIRLAPKPLDGASEKRMPAVVQDLVISPRLEYEGEEEETVSTASDYQPAERDAGRQWKRMVRTRNFISSVIMLVASAAVLLPYILAAAGVTAQDIPFKLIPERFDVISGWIDAFRVTADAGWQGEIVKSVWLAMIPDMILTLGLIVVIVGVLKTATGLMGAIRPRRYTAGAVVYLLTVAAVFIAALVGAEEIGLPRIDFMQDFIRGWDSSEFFTLFASAGIYVVSAAVCSFITPLRTGYTRVR